MGNITPHDAGDEQLKRLGYNPTLQRSLKLFANFGIAFCYISPVVGVYSLFGYGLSTGGPAFFWALPVVAIGSILVALIFGEVSSAFPLAGALYHWGKMLRGPRYGWLIGWIYGWALLTTIAAVDYAGAPYVAQLLGMEPKPGIVYVITLMMLLAHTVFNVVGVKASALVTDIGVYVEVAATLVLAGVLFASGTVQPVSVLFDTAAVQGNGFYLPCFLAAMLAPVWVFYGFESAGSVAEEVVDASRQVPRAIIYSLTGAIVMTALLYLALILSAPSIPEAMKDPAKTIAIIFEARLGKSLMLVFLGLVGFAFFSCATAIQAASARLIFAYARDRMIPGWKLFSRVSESSKAPIPALLLTGIVGLLTVLLTQINVGAVNVNALITTYASIGIYTSFMMVVFAYLSAKCSGWQPDGLFSLGKWGTPVAVGAFCYTATMIVNLAWPRPLNQLSGWFPILSAAFFIVSGLVWRSLHVPAEDVDTAIGLVPEAEPE